MKFTNSEKFFAASLLAIIVYVIDGSQSGGFVLVACILTLGLSAILSELAWHRNKSQ